MEAVGRMGEAPDSLTFQFVRMFHPDNFFGKSFSWEPDIVSSVVKAAMHWEATDALEDIRCWLGSLLEVGDEYQCLGALEAIGWMGSFAIRKGIVGHLVRLLQHQSFSICVTTVVTVSRLGPPAVSKEIIDCFAFLLQTGGPSSSMLGETEYGIMNKYGKPVQATIVALGLLGECVAREDILNALADRLKNEYDHYHRETVEAIGKIGVDSARDDILTQFARLLQNKDYRYLHDTLLEAIRRLGKAAFRNDILTQLVGLLPSLYHPCEFDPPGRALEALSSHDSFWPQLATLLEHQEEDVRRGALIGVGILGKAASQDIILTQLVRVLEDADSSIVLLAVKTVGKLSFSTAHDGILTRLGFLLDHSDKEVRSGAINAVGTFGAAAARKDILSHLERLLQHKDWVTRGDVENAIARIGAAAGCDTFLTSVAQQLFCSDPEMRPVAARIVGRLMEECSFRLFRKGPRLVVRDVNPGLSLNALATDLRLF